MAELEWPTKSEDLKVELVELLNTYFLCHASSGIDPASVSSPTAFESLKHKNQWCDAVWDENSETKKGSQQNAKTLEFIW